jgi:hypothetical protein
MVPWLDPRLGESAQRLMIYETLKLKAIANEEKQRIEQNRDTDEEERIKHQRWLRKLHVKQSITHLSQQNRLEREAQDLEERMIREKQEYRKMELLKEQLDKRREKELDAMREAYIRAHPHVYFINLPENLKQTSRRSGRDIPMEVVNFEEDSAVRRAIYSKPEPPPEKDFLEVNKHRVELISAGAKVYQQL